MTDSEIRSIFKDVYSKLKCKASCSSVGTPSLPFNSIQYNNNGAFFGDALALRDPVTNETIVKRVPSIGTDEGFESNDTLSFVSTFLGIPVSGTQLYWQDSNSGYGSSVFTTSFIANSPSVNMIVGNTISGNAASFATLLSNIVTQEWAINASTTNNTSNTEAQINILSDNTTSSGEIEAENTNTGELSKVKLLVTEALLQYQNGGGLINELRLNINGYKIKIDSGILNISGLSGVPSYANDATAVTGGLVSGDVYKTTTLGSTYLKIVP